MEAQQIKFIINDKEENKAFIQERKERIGCDKCKCDISTQIFYGYCGDCLYICYMCFEDLLKND